MSRACTQTNPGKDNIGRRPIDILRRIKVYKRDQVRIPSPLSADFLQLPLEQQLVLYPHSVHPFLVLCAGAGVLVVRDAFALFGVCAYLLD